MKLFAARMVKARSNVNMTQSFVAEKLEVTPQAVSAWERGEYAPDISKLKDLAKLYGVTLDWLLNGKEPDAAVVKATENLSDRLFDEQRMYTYIKSYATAKGLHQTRSILSYVRDMHKDQVRKGKDKVPYVNHPLSLACHAIALGLDEDNLLSAALLHDVCEDCHVDAEALPVNDATRWSVSLLTKNKEVTRSSEEGLLDYYRRLSEDRIALMVKLLDRCNNISNMASAFTVEKMASYIIETEENIYPLFEIADKNYPQYANQIYLIRYHMTSVIEALRQLMGKNK